MNPVLHRTKKKMKSDARKEYARTMKLTVEEIKLEPNEHNSSQHI